MDYSVNNNVKDKPVCELQDMPSQAAILILRNAKSWEFKLFYYKTKIPVELQLSNT